MMMGENIIYITELSKGILTEKDIEITTGHFLESKIKYIKAPNDTDEYYSLVESYEQIEKLQSEIELLESCVEFYAYPKHEDGDRAYIFGAEARAAIEKLKEIRGI